MKFSLSGKRYSATFWLVLIGVWTAVALLTTVVLYFRLEKDGTPVTWGNLTLIQVLAWYIWAVFTPVILWLGRNVHVQRGFWVLGIGFHALMSGLMSLFFIGSYVSIFMLVNGMGWTQETFLQFYPNFFLQLFNWDVMIYWGILCGGYAFEYYRQFRDRELKAVQLESQLVEAQLQALRMQLNPHFLFNTLHTIAAKVRLDEKESSVSMLAALSNLLRLVLDQQGQQEIPLQQELDLLEAYLRIETIRFQDKLQVDFQIGTGSRQALVPNLVLQPLVENAIKHGIAQQVEASKLAISAKREGDELLIRIFNEGPAITSESSASGIGLRNTRERLAQLYGEQAVFTIENRDNGVEASVRIPYRETPMHS